MYFHIIASGSKGNATVVVSNQTVILIDLGISKERLIEGLSEINLTIDDIDALIITHDHTDHVRGIKFVSPKIVYGRSQSIPSLGHSIELYEPFIIKDVEITAIETSHDADTPCGYIIKDKDNKFVYMTDTGIVCESTYKYVSNPTYLMIESNHDITMLLETNRPMCLKERILSEHGHLCNEDSAFAAIDIIGNNTKEIILAHISEEANTPETALEAYKKVFGYKQININNYIVKCAPQWHSLTGGNYEH